MKRNDKRSHSARKVSKAAKRLKDIAELKRISSALRPYKTIAEILARMSK